MITQRWAAAAAMAGAVALLSGCNTMNNALHGRPAGSGSNVQHVTLTGKSEVPVNDSTAIGQGDVTVASDRSVKVHVIVSGMTSTAAHIHEGAAGANGPVIVPLEKSAENTFVAKADAKLTETQYEAFKAGRTYLNVHSAKHPGGEIRAQLKGN